MLQVKVNEKQIYFLVTSYKVTQHGEREWCSHRS